MEYKFVCRLQVPRFSQTIHLFAPPTQVGFVSMAFGSGKKYTGQDMAKTHEVMIRDKGLGLVHFDAVAAHLSAAMQQLGVPEELVNEAAAIVMTTRPIFDPAQNGVVAAATAAAEASLATVAAPAAAPQPPSLYVRIGGAAAVQATVEVFYQRVMADQLLAPFFDGVDMGKQKAKQVFALFQDSALAFGDACAHSTEVTCMQYLEQFVRGRGSFAPFLAPLIKCLSVHPFCRRS